MELDEFLFRSKMKQKDFAAAVGVSKSSIAKWVKYRAIPSPEAALRIERFTGGKVNAWELICKCLEFQKKIKLESK